jgi:spore maturation protein CgeB
VCCDNKTAADLYRSSQCGLQLYRREANAPELSAGWAVGPREIEQAACGLFFLRESRPEGDELFPMLPTVSDPAEVGDMARWWVDHDDERRAAAIQARAAIDDRTFTRNARQLLQLLEA